MKISRLRSDADPHPDDLMVLLRKTIDRMEGFAAFLDRQPMKACLGNLQATVDSIGSAFPRHPVAHPRYAVEWSRFLDGKRKDLDGATARYLCWEPDIATSSRFLTYLSGCDMKLTRRPLAGLVRSCHQRWQDLFPVSPSIDMARNLLYRYDGPSPVVLKWKGNPDVVLSDRGPEILGRIVVEENRTLLSLWEEWYLDSPSPFVHAVVEAAIDACLHRLAKPTRGLLGLLFGELLTWTGWEPRKFRQGIARLILQGAVAGQTREILQQFILASSYLGDPRLAANRANWAEVPREATNLVFRWLAENPFRLLERVYQEGRGWTMRPHGLGNEELRAGQNTQQQPAALVTPQSIAN